MMEDRQTSLHKQIPTETEVVYVCSPNLRSQLCVSLRSLIGSGTPFNHVTIYSVAEKPIEWNLPRGLVSVVHVKPHGEETGLNSYGFLPNKSHMCRSCAGRVIYLDVDTIILKRLDTIWTGRSFDILARPASRTWQPSWNAELWKLTLREAGAADNYPYLNSGFVVFQNGAQQLLERPWVAIMRGLSLRKSLLQQLHAPRNIGQLSFSMAIGVLRLSYGLIGSREHAYGWEGDPYDTALVYHAGGGGFAEFLRARGVDLETAEQRLIEVLRTSVGSPGSRNDAGLLGA
jgi:hypothetical protein